MDKFLALKKNQFKMRNEAPNIAKQNNMKNTFQSTIRYDMVKMDLRLMFRWSPTQKWKEIDLKKDGIQVPYIDLDKVTVYENKEARISRPRESIIRPDKNMPAPRGRPRTEKSRSRSRNPNSRNGKNTRPIPDNKNTSRQLQGLELNSDPNAPKTTPILPSINPKNDGGKHDPNRVLLPMPSAEEVNKVLKENQKQAEIDDLLRGGARLANAEDVTDQEMVSPGVAQGAIVKRPTAKAGRKSNLQKAGSLNNNTITKWCDSDKKQSILQTPNNKPSKKRQASGEKPEPEAKKNDDKTTPESKKQPSGGEKVDLMDDLESNFWVLIHNDPKGELPLEYVNEDQPDHDMRKEKFHIHYPYHENAQFAFYLKTSKEREALEKIGEFDDYHQLDPASRKELDKERFAEEYKALLERRKVELEVEANRQRKKEQRAQRRKEHLVEEELRKARAKQKIKEQNDLNLDKASAARDKRAKASEVEREISKRARDQKNALRSIEYQRQEKSLTWTTPDTREVIDTLPEDMKVKALKLKETLATQSKEKRAKVKLDAKSRQEKKEKAEKDRLEQLQLLKDSKPQPRKSSAVISAELTDMLQDLKQKQEQRKAETKAEINKRKREKRKLNRQRKKEEEEAAAGWKTVSPRSSKSPKTPASTPATE